MAWRANITYVVKTNLPPDKVNAIGIEIFARWLEFALGGSVLLGKQLIYPTGRYAASLSYRREGESTVAIYADEHVAPEAAVIEFGHGPVDLKTRLQPGVYPMHRYTGVMPGISLRRIGSGPPSFRASMWADVRRSEFSGFATLGRSSPADSWVIPAMPAYSPAYNLSLIAHRMAEEAS